MSLCFSKYAERCYIDVFVGTLAEVTKSIIQCRVVASHSSWYMDLVCDFFGPLLWFEAWNDNKCRLLSIAAVLCNPTSWWCNSRTIWVNVERCIELSACFFRGKCRTFCTFNPLSCGESSSLCYRLIGFWRIGQTFKYWVWAWSVGRTCLWCVIILCLVWLIWNLSI
jgi:hypothetical protein